MKKIILLLFFIGLHFCGKTQKLYPYILGAYSSKPINTVKKVISKALSNNGLKVVGSYMPGVDKKRLVLIITHNELTKAVQKIGGLTGFAITLKVGITREDSITYISYTNPAYWGNAYFRKNYLSVKPNYDTVSEAFKIAMESLDSYKGTDFGSKKGLSVDDLHKYHYMVGMPYFNDVKELKEFNLYTTAIEKIDANLKKGVPNAGLVYKITIPNKELTIYGISLSGKNGEREILSKFDTGTPKHTSFLPYQILVKGKSVYMLHGRFRLPLSFPSLSIGTFIKCISISNNIEDMLNKIVE
jgi:hypothetical protein